MDWWMELVPTTVILTVATAPTLDAALEVDAVLPTARRPRLMWTGTLHGVLEASGTLLLHLAVGVGSCAPRPLL